MQMTTYLSFKGECEAAFKFYEQCLDGQLGAIFRYAGSPLADQVPADWQDKVMHGSFTFGDHVLMGGDVAPDRYEQPKGFSLSLQIQSAADAERIFHELQSAFATAPAEALAKLAEAMGPDAFAAARRAADQMELEAIDTVCVA